MVTIPEHAPFGHSMRLESLKCEKTMSEINEVSSLPASVGFTAQQLESAAASRCSKSLLYEDSRRVGEAEVSRRDDAGDVQGEQLFTHSPSSTSLPPASFTPRSRRTDITRYTPLSEIHNARNAYLLSDSLGKPLNTFLTINFNRDHRHWEIGNRSRSQVSYVREKRMVALRDWWRDADVEPHWINCIENPSQGGHGPHMHILFHLPQDRWQELCGSLEECLRVSMGWSRKKLDRQRADFEAREAKNTPSRGSEETWLPFYISPSEKGPGLPLDARQSLACLRYICKSVDPEQVVEIGEARATFADHAEVYTTLDPYITIEECGDTRTRKRVGASRSLGIDVRRKRGWQETTDLDWMSRKIERAKLHADTRKLLSGLDWGPYTSLVNSRRTECSLPEPETSSSESEGRRGGDM